MADLDQTPQNGTLSAENANINLLQCRVYIAGILLPTISVNIRCVFNDFFNFGFTNYHFLRSRCIDDNLIYI